MWGPQAQAIHQTRLLLIAPNSAGPNCFPKTLIPASSMLLPPPRRSHEGSSKESVAIFFARSIPPRTAVPVASKAERPAADVTPTIFVEVAGDEYLSNPNDIILDLLGRSIQIELVSSELEPEPSSERSHEDAVDLPYLQRDEAFSQVKGVNIKWETVKSTIYVSVLNLLAFWKADQIGFLLFTTVDTLFHECVRKKKPGGIQDEIFSAIQNLIDRLLQFEIPDLYQSMSSRCSAFHFPQISVYWDLRRTETVQRLSSGEELSWLRYEEFSRQISEGINPLSIEFLKELHSSVLEELHKAAHSFDILL